MYHPFIFLAAGFTQGVSGFGAALVAMPLLAYVMDVKTAVPLCMLNGLVITLYLSLQLKSHIDRKKIMSLLLGALPGIITGVFVLKSFSSYYIKILLGLMIISYSVYSLATKPKPKKIKSFWSYLAGFLTGLIGTTFAAGGPPVVIYVSLTNWAKDEIKATLSVFFFITGVLIATGHAISGITTGLVLQYFAESVLCTIIGVWAGSKLYNRIKQHTYVTIMLWLLIVMGVMMLIDV